MKKTTKKTKAARPTLERVLDRHTVLNRFKFESIGRIAILLQEFPSGFCMDLYVDLLGLADDSQPLNWYVLDEKKTRAEGVTSRRMRP